MKSFPLSIATVVLTSTLIAGPTFAAGGSTGGSTAGGKSALGRALSHRVSSSHSWQGGSRGNRRTYRESRSIRVEMRRPLFRVGGKLFSLPMFSKKAAERRLAKGKSVGLRVKLSSMMMGSGGPPLSIGVKLTKTTEVRSQSEVKTWFDNVARPTLEKRARSERAKDGANVNSTLDPKQLLLPFK